MASRRGIRKAVVSATLGLGYGAVVGALVGAAFGLSLWVFPNVRSNALGFAAVGALLGLCLGGVGGGAFGLLGSVARGPASWGLAGAGGGLITAALFHVLMPWLIPFGSIPEVLFTINDWFPLLPILAAALIGFGFGLGVKRQRSPLPGVAWLAAAVAAADGAARARTAATRRVEVIPASPSGGGHEATPVAAGPAATAPRQSWGETIGEAAFYPAFASVSEGIPPAARLPLFEILVGLRTRRLAPDEFWRRWAALPVADPGCLNALRVLVEAYLGTRDQPIQPSWGGFGQESPDRQVARMALESVLRCMKQRDVGSEALPADAPTGRGDEPSPAE
jgi:hypothetical protein